MKIFHNCKKLKNVSFSKNSKLKIIGNHSFNYNIIEDFSLPQHVTIIGNNAFTCCINLTNFNIPSNSKLEIINYGAFQQTNIKQIFIPKQVEVIDNFTFLDCQKYGSN